MYVRRAEIATHAVLWQYCRTAHHVLQRRQLAAEEVENLPRVAGPPKAVLRCTATQWRVGRSRMRWGLCGHQSWQRPLVRRSTVDEGEQEGLCADSDGRSIGLLEEDQVAGSVGKWQQSRSPTPHSRQQQESSYTPGKTAENTHIRHNEKRLNHRCIGLFLG
eukprot:364311-Chlamydomonas_euryale.AAC.1